MNVSTDKALIEEFLTRGVEAIYPTTDALRQKLLSGERIRVYQGFDPTGKYLHVGHAMGIRAMAILQKLGHEVIFLVGDYTARVGDPDKDSARKMLTQEEIAENMKGWKEQAAQLIDFDGPNPVLFKHNYEWLAPLNFNDLIMLMSKMTVQQMLERDMFERRLKQGDPIGLHEFIYPLMQGYDGVAMAVDLEIGGADQTFNMLTGRNLSKAYLGKEKFVRANKMMDAPDGRTMSKTKGNGINLGDSSFDMYGKAMSYADDKICMGLELITNVPLDEIKKVAQAIAEGENPMQFKKMMAFEIVKAIRGEQEAKKAQDEWLHTFSDKGLPSDVPQFSFILGETLIDLLVRTTVAESKTKARILIEEGAVKNAETEEKYIDQTMTVPKNTVLKIGKKRFVKIV